MHNAIIWSHRGGSFSNSISSYKRAYNLGADGIKIEARTSKDGTVLFTFQSKIEIEGNNIEIRDLDSKEILKYYSIPTLSELYNEFYDSPLIFNFDIWDKETGLRIIEFAQKHNFADRIELTKPATLDITIGKFFKPLRDEDSSVKCVNSVCAKYSNIEEENLELEQMIKHNIGVINVQHIKLNQTILKAVKDNGLRLYVWGVIFKYFMSKYLKMDQINGIFSYRLENLVNLRKKFQN